MKSDPRTRRLFTIVGSLAVLLGAIDAAHATKFTVEGGDTKWSNPANWELKGQPTADLSHQRVRRIIDALVDLDVSVTMKAVTLGGSGNGGTIRGAGGSLTVTRRLDIANGGFFAGPATSVNLTSTATLPRGVWVF